MEHKKLVHRERETLNVVLPLAVFSIWSLAKRTILRRSSPTTRLWRNLRERNRRPNSGLSKIQAVGVKLKFANAILSECVNCVKHSIMMRESYSVIRNCVVNMWMERWLLPYSMIVPWMVVQSHNMMDIEHTLNRSLFKGNHIATFSHLISFITDTVKRHTLETLFREAKGRKSTQLPREFIKSIGADQFTSSSSSSSYPNEKDVLIPGITKAKSTGDLTDNHSSPTSPIPTSPIKKPWKSLAYPSSLPISCSLQDEWKEYKWNLSRYNDLSKLLVKNDELSSCQ